MRQWSKLLRNPASTLHGFDSFLGLPHDWTLEGHERGYFSTEGQVPEIDDPRVRFFVGWFEETLPQYEWPEHEVLVVVLDADLYSSTSRWPTSDPISAARASRQPPRRTSHG